MIQSGIPYRRQIRHEVPRFLPRKRPHAGLIRKVTMSVRDIISSVIIAGGAVGLLIIGGILAYNNQTGAAKAALGFAFLFSVLLVAARFKRFKGFGFEAEMWDQKQIEAAALIDRLSILSATSAEQTGLIASHLGLMDSGFTNPELAELLNQMERTLSATDIEKSKRNAFAAPVIKRIKKNYVFVATYVTEKAYTIGVEDIERSPRTGALHEDLIAKCSQLNLFRHNLNNIREKLLIELNSLTPLIDVVKASPDFNGRDRLLGTLSELDEDLKYFTANLQLRRNIDIDYVFRK